MAPCRSAALRTYTYSEAGPVSSSRASRRIVTRSRPAQDAGPKDVDSHFRSQRMQRAGIKGHVKD
jgi:hypothetical protein